VVTLTSPHGTTPLSVNNLIGSNSGSDIVFTNQTVVNFNGELAAGTWTLAIKDISPTGTGTLNSWSLAIVGSCP
jgi:subtilisin-like proprotein convertase family protein